MTEDEAKQKVIDLANSEVGYREKASNANLDDKTANSGGANWTKYARDLDTTPDFYNGKKNGYAWCDIFVDWLFVKCFGAEKGRQMLYQPKQSAGAGCLYSAGYYKSANAWHKTHPRLGDQIFFSYSAGEYSHTGIVVNINGNTITTIEGNTSDSVGRRTYETSNPVIAGYGTPKWSLAEDFVVVQNGQIVNSSEKEDVATAILYPTPTENHSWSPPLLRYAPDDYYEACKLMQTALNVRNFDSGKADGYFGPKTQVAVNRARAFYGLVSNNVCDADLWGKLGVKGT